MGSIGIQVEYDGGTYSVDIPFLEDIGEDRNKIESRVYEAAARVIAAMREDGKPEQHEYAIKKIRMKAAYSQGSVEAWKKLLATYRNISESGFHDADTVARMEVLKDLIAQKGG